jgi:hypothetical protein
MPPASLQDYLDFIEDVAKKVANVVVLSIPSAHTLAHTGKQVQFLVALYTGATTNTLAGAFDPDSDFCVHIKCCHGLQGPALLRAYRSRNTIMKRWVSQRPAGSNIHFVDFDAMSLSSNAPPICSNENWHYQVPTADRLLLKFKHLAVRCSNKLSSMLNSPASAMQCFLTWPATSNKVHEAPCALDVGQACEDTPPSDMLSVWAGGIARHHHQLVSRQVLISAGWWQDSAHCAVYSPALGSNDTTSICYVPGSMGRHWWGCS